MTTRLAAADRLTRIQSSLAATIPDPAGMLYLAGQPVMSYAELVQLVQVARTAREIVLRVARQSQAAMPWDRLRDLQIQLTKGWPR